MVQTHLERIEAHPLGGKQLQHPGLNGLELQERDEALGRRGLVGYADQQPAGAGEAFKRSRSAWNQSEVSPPQRGFWPAAHRIRDQLVDDSVAVDKHSAAATHLCAAAVRRPISDPGRPSSLRP